jgi:hypothetical protein
MSPNGPVRRVDDAARRVAYIGSKYPLTRNEAVAALVPPTLMPIVSPGRNAKPVKCPMNGSWDPFKLTRTVEPVRMLSQQLDKHEPPLMTTSVTMRRWSSGTAISYGVPKLAVPEKRA